MFQSFCKCCSFLKENAKIKKTQKALEDNATLKTKKKKYGWEFLFIGANIDAVETAALYGIGRDRAVNYNADKKGTEIVYKAVNETVCKLRANAPVCTNWGETITRDYNLRGKNK